MKEIYYKKLYSAVLWGFDKERPSYLRAVEYIKEHSKSHSFEQLEELREELLAKSGEVIEVWLDKVYEMADDKNNLFDLSMTDEELWIQMVCINQGIFHKEYSGDPWVVFCRTIASQIEGEWPVMISINIDGWGL